MKEISRIDLHMHTTVSDGTDRPEEIIGKVKSAGIDLFSVTDHDAIKGSIAIRDMLKDDDPLFITGAEFSCKDEEGKYHILGYSYDPDSRHMKDLVKLGHGYRISKVMARLDFLKEEFGFAFTEDEISELLSLDNPGKPHIGNLMVKHGYARTRKEAITEFIDRKKFKTEYVRPEEAIDGILKAGGIPVLAHPSYGSGEEIIVGENMEARLKKLMEYGLQGVEAFYSGFTNKLISEMLFFADKYDLYVTVGSDYHGKNKMEELGDNNLPDKDEWPGGLLRFLKAIGLG